MEEKKPYRHELKYPVSYTDYLAIRSRIRSIMSSDPHTNADGRYRIRSIYFDNSDDKALHEKTDGIAKREKFRIRYYNDDFSFITLEKKMKINNLCLKYDAPITKEECRMILDGDLDFMRDHKEELVRELYAKMYYQRLRPRVLVSYVREPYIYAPGNVRVTFDCNISSSTQIGQLFSSYLPVRPILSSGQHLMEVKYDSFLPDFIYRSLNLGSLRQTAFSKYYLCRKYSL